MIDTHFQTLTQFTPRQFQRDTITKILNQENVILRAPTGSGKTETAIAPFLFSQLLNPDFPQKLIYVVPLRTLANSLRKRTEEYIKTWSKIHPYSRPLVVTLQTGENPEDPRFEGDIIFCTIDQMLSSFLNIPYSVGRGSGNINAGVFFASYLVFDEIHLLDPDRSFTTLIEVLKQVNGISPFLLMTATLTDELATQLQQEIAIPHLIRVETEDLQAIEGNRKRNYKPILDPLSADSILNHPQSRQIVICNTVSQSQALFQDLQAIKDDQTKITLLHARFLPEHRRQEEEHLNHVFSQDWQNDGYRHILIATQVIEAGLNLTCDVLHTQLCPMNSLLQRGGRCARFTGEEGTVLIYRQIATSQSCKDLAEADFDENEVKTNKRQFLPYSDDLCKETWKVLRGHSGENSVGYRVEEEWIEQVHAKDDRLQWEKRINNCAEFANNFHKALFSGDQSVADDLIRNVESRNLFVWEESAHIDFNSDEPEINPQFLQSFSIPLTTLRGIWGKYQQQEYKTNWLFKRITTPKKKENDTSDSDTENYSQPVCLEIKSFSELAGSFRILVNPRYLFYDKSIGLRIGIDIEGNQFISPPRPPKPIPDQYHYRMDTYTAHLGCMGQCWRNHFPTRIYKNGETVGVTFSSVRDELLSAGGRFIQTKLFPHTSLEDCQSLYEILVLLAIFTHDLGKLQTKWQSVMRGWQEKAYQEFNGTNPKNHLIAHTDYDPKDALQKAASEEYEKKNRRPPHAVESAFLSREILINSLFPLLETHFQATREQIIAILHTLIMSTGRHHSAWSAGWNREKSQKVKQIQLHPDARDEIKRSWEALSRLLPDGFTIPTPHLSQDCYEARELPLNRFLETDLPYLQLYSLVARALRLCDQRSVQWNNKHPI